MKIFTTVSAVLIAGAVTVSAATEQELRKDISNANKRLAEQRQKQAQQAPELGNRVADLERQLLTMRRQARQARMTTDGRADLLKKLERDLNSFERDAQYLNGVYRDFSLQFSAHFQPGQAALYGDKVELAQSQTLGLTDKAVVLDSAMDQLESVLGGEILTAEVVDDQGKVVKGKVANVGPASWFAADNGSAAGAVNLQKGATHPSLLEVDNDEAKALAAGQSSNLEIDFTGGKARAIAQVQSGSNDLLRKGGVWLIPILSIALVSVVCGVIKMLQLLKIKDPSAGWVAEILEAVRADDTAKAQQVAESAKHPAAALLSKAITFTSAGADVVEEVIYEQLIGVQSQLQKWLPFIAVTAATAPLLGLLGTVSGMIRMFNVITVTGTGDVKPMAGGISEALVTTLFGLVVAIPALIMHTMLSRRSNGVVQVTEKLGLTFVNGLRKQK